MSNTKIFYTLAPLIQILLKYIYYVHKTLHVNLTKYLGSPYNVQLIFIVLVLKF